MKPEDKIHGASEHRAIRGTLRTIGPLVLIGGVVLLVIGIGDFFMSFGSFEPKYFWCAFLGMPMIAIGGGMTQYGYMGKITRYVSREIAPAGKDTFNYLADGTKPGVKNIAQALGEGLSAGMRGTATPGTVACPVCDHLNDADARFCDQCGHALVTTKLCRSCGKENDADARFCDQCGESL